MAQSSIRSQLQTGRISLQFENQPSVDSRRADSWSVSSFWRNEDPDKNRKAVVKKNGSFRMFVKGLDEHKHKFLVDLFLTIIDLAWLYLIAVLFILYLTSFLMFAVLWWLMAHNNGDFENLNNPAHELCLHGVKSFLDTIMFSMETQTTIGYGFSHPDAHCAGTVPLLYLQVVVGLFLETVMFGSVFVKIAQPKHRSNTILFSKNAVICQDNGQLVLQVRIGDLRRSHLIECSVAGMLIDQHVTKEGHAYPLYQFNCDFTAYGMSDQMFLMYPIVVRHVIDKDSPLYDVSMKNLQEQKFEIIVYLTGTVESTGAMCQARTSYLPSEILWGYRFDRIERFDTRHGQWRVNFTDFDKVLSCQVNVNSAKQQENETKTDGSIEIPKKIELGQPSQTSRVLTRV